MPAVLITGASRGIGAAACRRFAAAGYDILMVARPSDDMDRMVAELAGQGSRVEAAAIDLADPAAIGPGLAELLDRASTPAVLINNAGAAWTGGLLEMPLDRWQWLLQLNLTSVFQVCAAVVPRLRTAGGGLVINVSSHAARNAFPDWGAYCTSKAALAAFSRCLATEERGNGIRVSTLTLGSVNTPLWDSATVHSSFDRRAMLPPEQVAEALLFLAQQSPDQVVEDLTLMPAAGAL